MLCRVVDKRLVRHTHDGAEWLPPPRMQDGELSSDDISDARPKKGRAGGKAGRKRRAGDLDGEEVGSEARGPLPLSRCMSHGNALIRAQQRMLVALHPLALGCLSFSQGLIFLTKNRTASA